MPLAFIHWYTPLRDPTNDIGMIRIKASTNTGRLTSSIIPVSDIERTCHLMPEFGRVTPNTWTPSTVLDLAPYFHINPYLRHRDFYIFRYRIYCQEKRERDRAEEVARKRARYQFAKTLDDVEADVDW
jgi:hypothetical protein